MDENEKRITIADLGEILGVHFNTIRQWEKQFDIIVPRSKDTQKSRYYTENEISIFKKISDLRKENMSIDNIKRYLDRDLEAIEQDEKGIQALPFSEVTAADIKSLISDIILEREQNLKDEFKRELQEELAKQEIRIIEEVSQRHLEQIQSENEKLINYILESKEQERSKGLFSRLFKK